MRYLLAVLGVWAGFLNSARAEETMRPTTSEAAAATKEPRDLAARLQPKPVPTPDRAAIESAIKRGIKFLLDDQRKDGAWGSAENTKDLNIFAPVPGAHLSFRAATTSLCVAALCETGGDDPEVAAAIEKGEAWLTKHLSELRRDAPEAIYNIWAHGYSLTALAHLIERHAGDAPRQETLRALGRQQMDFLRRFECVDGGWGYYDFSPTPTQKPSASSTSFQSAAVLISMKEAQAAGIEPPAKIVERALASLHRQQKPDYSYLYGEYLKWRPMHPVNRQGGSLGRTQACNFALAAWGDEKIDADVLTLGLDRLFARNLWLDIGRKRPIPHESWFAVAGYFFYFGHYYAGRCIERLPVAEQGPQQDQLATILLRLQEKDGSWWDYPLYNYHQQYGTAFALMTLKRCQREREK